MTSSTTIRGALLGLALAAAPALAQQPSPTAQPAPPDPVAQSLPPAPAAQPPMEEDIRDIKPAIAVEEALLWPWVLAAMAAAGAGGALVWRRRRGRELTPHEQLMHTLAQAAELLHAGDTAGYADLASEGIRRFVQARSDVPAERLTREELDIALVGIIPDAALLGLSAFLAQCDAVRFAGAAVEELTHESPWLEALIAALSEETHDAAAAAK